MLQKIKNFLFGYKFKNENKKNERLIQQMVEIIFRGKTNEQLTLKKIEKGTCNRHMQLLNNFYVDKSGELFIKTFKEYINDIFELNSDLFQTNLKLKEINEDKSNEIKQLKETIVSYKKDTTTHLSIDYINYNDVDIEIFNTKKYKDKFLQYCELDKNDEEQLNMFNLLINEEKIYLQGIDDCIYNSKELKNKNKSLANQLEDYYLTTYGIETIKINHNESLY